MTRRLLSTKESLFPFHFSMFYAHGRLSETLVASPVRTSSGGTQNTYNGGDTLHEPLADMSLPTALARNKFVELPLPHTKHRREKWPVSLGNN